MSKPKNLAEAEKQIEDLLLQKFEDPLADIMQAKLFAAKLKAEMDKQSILTQLQMAQVAAESHTNATLGLPPCLDK
jgi:hypothetical protein